MNETKETKIASKGVLIALGIICIILVACLGGARARATVATYTVVGTLSYANVSAVYAGIIVDSIDPSLDPNPCGSFMFLTFNGQLGCTFPEGFVVGNMVVINGTISFDEHSQTYFLDWINGSLCSASAVMSVAPSKNVVGQGCQLPVNVMLMNMGNQSETFNVTAYANTTILGSQNVTLATDNSATVQFIWNTTGFAYGNCNIGALAGNLTAGTSMVLTMPGDVNGDFTVDIYDAITLAGGFNTHVGNLHWNVNADINGDNTIDIYDAIILAGHFNQHYP